MKKYLAEFIGTFFLVLITVMVSNNGVGHLAPLAIGLVFGALIFAGRHISGAHFNPAITIALAMRGKVERGEFLYYFLAQMLAGAVAACIAVLLLQCTQSLEFSARKNEPICALLAEFLGAFALIWVVLNVSAPRNERDTTQIGLASGLVLAGLGMALGQASGGLFNLATMLATCIAGTVAWGDAWIYVLGNALGAVAAASVFQAIFGNE